MDRDLPPIDFERLHDEEGKALDFAEQCRYGTCDGWRTRESNYCPEHVAVPAVMAALRSLSADSIDGLAHRSLRSLAGDTGYSVLTVRGAISDLEARGVIEMIAMKEPNRPLAYRLKNGRAERSEAAVRLIGVLLALDGRE